MTVSAYGRGSLLRAIPWTWRVFASRWRHRVRYLLAAPLVYRNWWALPLSARRSALVLELRNGLRFRIRSGSGDLGIVKGVQKLLEMKRRPAPSTMLRVAEVWRPYRSVAAWYLWRLHD